MAPIQTSPAPPGDLNPVTLAGMSAEPPALSAPPGFDTVVHVLRRRWPLILVAGLVAAALAAAVTWLIIPGRYSAQMVLEVRRQPNRGEDEAGAAQRAQAFALKDPRVLNAALDRDSIAPLYNGQSRQDLVAWLQKDLVVDFPAGLDVTRVTLTGDRPEQLAPILSAVASAYEAKCEERDRARALERIEQLKRQYQDEAKLLRMKKSLLQATEQKLGYKNPAVAQAEREMLLRALENANHERRIFKPQLRKAVADWCSALVQLNDPDQIMVDPVKVDLAFRSEPRVISLFADLAQAEKTLAHDLDVSGNPNAPAVLQGKKTVKRVQDQIDARWTEARPGLEKLLREQLLSDLRKNLDTVESQAFLAQAQDEVLALDIERLEKELKELTASTRTEGSKFDEMFQLADDVQKGENTLKRLNDDIVSNTVNPTNVVQLVLEEPTTPSSARNDRRYKFMVGAAGGAFALVFLAVGFLEYRGRRVYVPDDVGRGLGVPLLGSIPSVGSAARRPLADDAATVSVEQSALMESIDAVRTVILHTARSRPLRLLMVTSAGMGEGKSTLAVQLAASLARSWRRVLLIDGDLRHPSAHEVFGTAQAPGLSEVLRNELHADEATQPTSLNRLALLPAGRCDRHALEALSQETLGELFNGLKDLYDFIVLDVGPVLPVSDALQFGQHVDGVVLSVLRDVTRLPELWTARQRLAGLNVPVLGAVVTGGRPSVYGVNAVPLRLNG